MVNLLNAQLAKYKIVLPLIFLIFGIVLSEYIANIWLAIIILGPITAITSLILKRLRFLLFIPIGLLFTAGPVTYPENSISSYYGDRIELQGTLYKPAENRVRGQRIYMDAHHIIRDGVKIPVNGRVIIYSDNIESSIAYGDELRILGVKLSPFKNYKIRVILIWSLIIGGKV